MNKKETQELMKRIRPYLEDVRERRRMFVFPPYKDILKGLYFEPSGTDAEHFYVWAFFMPLCIPSQHIAFNLGQRIGGIEGRWSFKDPLLTQKIVHSVENEALPFLARIQSPLDGAHLALFGRSTRSPYVLQANAYLLALTGQSEEASISLDRLLSLLDLGTPWQARIADEARELKRLLAKSPAEARAKLRVWESETIHNLGLEEIGFAV
jgi:hypothetical protein